MCPHIPLLFIATFLLYVAFCCTTKETVMSRHPASSQFKQYENIYETNMSHANYYDTQPTSQITGIVTKILSLFGKHKL